MKLHHLLEGVKLFHRLSPREYRKLRADGELVLKKGFFAASKTKDAGINDDFGKAQLELDKEQLLQRGAKLLEVVYTLAWLERNNVLVYVTGRTAEAWYDWAAKEYPDSNPVIVIDNEIKEAYGSEKEIIVFTSKLLLSDINRR